jgi:hypothetical protein
MLPARGIGVPCTSEVANGREGDGPVPVLTGFDLPQQPGRQPLSVARFTPVRWPHPPYP